MFEYVFGYVDVEYVGSVLVGGLVVELIVVVIEIEYVMVV